MTSATPTTPRRAHRVLGLVAGTLALAVPAACTLGPEPTAHSPAASTASSPSSTAASGTTPGTTTPGTTARATTTSSPTSSPTPSSTPTAPSCAQQLASRLTPAQRIGQLLMVGLQPSGSSHSLATQVGTSHLGGVIYLGGWEGASTVRTVSQRLQAATTQRATGGVRLLIAADQEGGRVQQLRAPGFTRVPSARVQATLGAVALTQSATAWGRELAKAGVNVNLAPVADTVPTSLGAANGPIGAHRRDFNPGDPAANGRDVAAFVRGTLAAGVAPTVKHFPGLGRVTGNTDLTSSGITDRTTSATDSYLQPFAAGIRAGTPLVMISSARYPKIDGENQAMFSKAVITDLLRGRMRYQGVVITDDVGAAKAVAAVPIGQRATWFIAAGGDIVLTASPGQAPVMISAISARMKQSPAFAGQVEASVVRVLGLKVQLGLASCGG